MASCAATHCRTTQLLPTAAWLKHAPAGNCTAAVLAALSCSSITSIQAGALLDLTAHPPAELRLLLVLVKWPVARLTLSLAHPAAEPVPKPVPMSLSPAKRLGWSGVTLAESGTL
jgi:hypothetical protein